MTPGYLAKDGEAKAKQPDIVTLFIPGTGSAALWLVSSERHSRPY